MPVQPAFRRRAAADRPAADEGEPSKLRPEPSPRELELKRRVDRGSSERFSIRALRGTRVFGAYDVGSPSSTTWRVELRALDARENGCTCPDFGTSQLGTCKHVEAVLAHLRRDAPRRFARALADGPPSSYLHLVHEPELAVGIRIAESARPAVRRFAARHLGAGRLSPDALAERTLEAARGDRRRKACPASLKHQWQRELRDAMAHACRALDDRTDPGEEPAALLLAVHGHLVPSGALDAAGAASLARAGELARAFGESSLALPEAIVAAVAREARALVSRAEGRRGPTGGREAPPPRRPLRRPPS